MAPGRVARLDGWLDGLGDAEVAARPPLALAAALCRVADGDRDAAERWAGLPRCMCRRPAPGRQAPASSRRRSRATAWRRWSATRRGRRGTGPWRSFADLLEGSGHALAGRMDEARVHLDQGARGAVFDAPLVRSLCLAQLAFIALDAGDPEDAAGGGALPGRRSIAARTPACPLAALTFAVCALVLASRGQFDARAGTSALRPRAWPRSPTWRRGYGASRASRWHGPSCG